MHKMLVALVVTIAASILMGAFIGLTATGRLTTAVQEELPNAILTVEITDGNIPLSSGRYIITRPGFFGQQIGSGVLDSAGTARIVLKSGITYDISVSRDDGSACRSFVTELIDGAAVSLSCV